MDLGFLKALIYNVCLLLGVGVVYSEINLRPGVPGRSRNFLTGGILGLVGIGIMLNPWILRPGRVFDVRSILLGVVGVFFGPLPTLLAAAVMALFRFYMGGAGTGMGIAVIFSSSAVGLLWRYFRPRIAVNPGLGELFLFGLAVHLAMLGCAVFLPSGMALETLSRISLLVLSVYPAGTVLLSLLFLRQAERENDRLALAESEERYRAVSEYSNNAICIVDTEGKIKWVNRKMLSMGGFPKEEYLSAPTFARFIAPESREFVVSNLKKFAAGAEYERHYFFSIIRADGAERLCEKYLTDYRDRNGRRNLVISMTDVTDRKQAEQERYRLMAAMEQAGETIIITDPEGRIQYANPALEKVTGYGRGEILGKTPAVFKSGKQDEVFYKELWKEISSGRTWTSRMVNKRKDGSLYTEAATISPVKDERGRIVNYVAVKRDITEQLHLEQLFRQAQKMDAVGTLAGGLAHDFNNILTAIKGYCGLLNGSMGPENPGQEDLQEIMRAADRATTLTRQLLAFSRRQMLAPQVVDLNKVLADISKMLRRLIGEDIRLSTKLFPAPCLAKVDPGQVEQVIMNLVLNAKDAVSGQGEIVLETELARPGEEFFAARPELKPGRLVCIKVSDTGMGMSAEVRGHIFEPFYTTKEPGKGTGLGLSVVFGIVKQSGGEIEVESAPGRGSVFRVCFPYADGAEADGSGAGNKPGQTRGSETVLFVEDEESLRRLGERLLRAYGYEVLCAADAKEALKIMADRGRPVDLLVTDVVMPGMSGRELARELAGLKLAGRTLYMSGYTDDAIVKHGVLEPGIAFIYKPFTAEGLALKMREALDGPADQAKP